MPIALNWISGSAVLARAASFIILAVKVVPGAGRQPRPHTDLAWAIVGRGRWLRIRDRQRARDLRRRR
ncbi:MAG: hypothetical protein ACLP50_07675 [Solirubrobacteraceae bacterium]